MHKDPFDINWESYRSCFKNIKLDRVSLLLAFEFIISLEFLIKLSLGIQFPNLGLKTFY